MEEDIVYYHALLQESIHAVERDESDREALERVKEYFLKVFELIKMIMISRQERYYGCFLMNFELCTDPCFWFEAGVSIDTLPFRMTVNPLLIGLRSLPEMIYILCHEIEHLVLNHPADGIKYNREKDPETAVKLNLAMDASINDRLSMDSRTKAFCVMTEPEDATTSGRLRDRYLLHIKALQAFDYYFERIPSLAETPGEKLLSAGGTSPDEMSPGGMSPGGTSPDEMSPGGTSPDEMSPGGMSPGGTSPDGIVTAEKRKNTRSLHRWTESDDADEVSALIRSFVADVIAQMPESMRSSLPEHQRRALDELVSPPVLSWKQLLKRYIGTIPDGHRKTRTRLSRRQPERYDISGSIADRVLRLAVAVDTSGSMSEEQLERVIAEIFGIIGARRAELSVIECDAEIQRVYRLRSPGDLSRELHGGGGTSFVPVIEFINENRVFRDAILIYFTDGMGDASIPRPLCRRIMWVLQDEDCRLSVREPYGEVLVMD